ncbi:MAG: aminotransferase class III-fold pyridoxal phosphate-dependent enzyme [Pseudomonadota bacterium]
MPENNPDLLSLEQVYQLDLDQTRELFAKHMNKGQLHFLRLLGFDRVLIQSANGATYTTVDGREILDMFGGFGSLACGHNHPRILKARKSFQDEERHEIAMAFMSQYAAGLSRNLAALTPEDMSVVFLANCGSVANEAALKLSERQQGSDRRGVAYASNSFHGKTRAALSVTDSAMYQDSFTLLDTTRRVEFGNLDALRDLFASDPSIGTFILETVQGGAGIVFPPDGYIEGVRRLCDEFSVNWIADEVQCGYGRTGKFFAFEHYDVWPDIVTLAKSLGGGKTAMGAYIAKDSIHRKAYGEPKNALIHGPATFSGMGEACVTSIEALNVLFDEELIENSRDVGDHLLRGLQTLQGRYPKFIKAVRGKGLMLGIEFSDISKTVPAALRPVVGMLDDRLKGSVCGFVGSLLLRDHGVLVAFTEYNRNVVRLEPPLILSTGQADYFLESLDEVLSRGITGIVQSFVRSKVKY